MIIYHGSTVVVSHPIIRTERFNKDFYFGFYCTIFEKQAIRWATRFGDGFLNRYEYTPNEHLKKLTFAEMTEEWLEFIAACRTGKPHCYDIVEGPMADDTIYNYVQGYIDGKYTRETFWSLARFKHPTHQISFHTEAALDTITFLGASEIHEQ
jgi:hypothetical protein